MKSDVEIIKIDVDLEADFESKVKQISIAFASLNPPKKLVATTSIGTTVIMFYDYACEGCGGVK